MKKTLSKIDRRQFLRGTVNGAAITLGLPILDCFLNTNGTAWASGGSLPPCFVTWFQGNGLTPGLWEPKSTGDKGYSLPEMMKPLDPFKSKLTIFTGMAARLAGHSLQVHVSGWQVLTQGGITKNSDMPSLDTLIGDHIGKQSRFRSLEVNASGTAVSYSRRSASSVNPSENSPLKLYGRIFGSDYVDPNKADFKPDPALMVRRSALSAFGEQRQSLLKTVGANDRVRLDEYFTSLRELENQLDQSLRKPEPMQACVAVDQPPETKTGMLMDTALENHKLFAQLVAHAFACGQSRIANVIFAEAGSTLRSANSTMVFHNYTHEELPDPQLGYQKMVAWFMARGIEAFGTFLQTLDSVREGPRTLLDRSAVMFMTDHGHAKNHSLSNVPVMIAGDADRRLKPGLLINAQNEPLSRIGLTLQRAFGMPVSGWGTEANATTQIFTEMLA